MPQVADDRFSAMDSVVIETKTGSSYTVRAAHQQLSLAQWRHSEVAEKDVGHLPACLPPPPQIWPACHYELTKKKIKSVTPEEVGCMDGFS